ncbi:MAG: hypothetical protein LBS25_06650 [Candidatus Symbiothrix sp.]|jgi:hypothetical protein|nr:hypothetical protein [Candidatus Symbiothrix sp.]
MTLHDLHKVLSRGEDLHNEFKKAETKVPSNFYDDDLFRTNISLISTVLGKERASTFMENLELAPELAQIEDWDEKGRLFLGGLDTDNLKLT